MVAPVLVGVDGSPGSLKAVEFAVFEAELRRRPLVVFRALPTPVVDAAIGMTPQFLEVTEENRTAAWSLVDSVIAHVAEQAPGLSVTGEVTESIAVGAAIIDRSRDCELVVVGSRGRGGFSDLLLGSTSSQVAVHAECPVVVVRPPHGEPGAYRGKIVVGVDDSMTSQPALAFGFDEASRRGVSLVAIHVFAHPDPRHADPDRVVAEESRMLAEALAGWQGRYPDVKVVKVVKPGSARRLLCDLSTGAALLAVGSRGRGGFTGMIFGSTSLAILHHATVPVAVARRLPADLSLS
ncbi:MAG: universal stress protein, partial [Stackebrandtia sp.]